MKIRKVCRYCTKEMKQKLEGYQEVYECDCVAYLQEMELKKELRKKEIEMNQVKSKLRELKDKSALSKDIIKLNEKYGISMMY